MPGNPSSDSQLSEPFESSASQTPRRILVLAWFGVLLGGVEVVGSILAGARWAVVAKQSTIPHGDIALLLAIGLLGGGILLALGCAQLQIIRPLAAFRRFPTNTPLITQVGSLENPQRPRKRPARRLALTGGILVAVALASIFGIRFVIKKMQARVKAAEPSAPIVQVPSALVFRGEQSPEQDSSKNFRQAKHISVQQPQLLHFERVERPMIVERRIIEPPIMIQRQPVMIQSQPVVIPPTPLRPDQQAFIQNVWTEYNAWLDGVQGMWVHLKLQTTNLLQEPLQVIVTLYYNTTGNALTYAGSGGENCGGELCATVNFVPPYQISTYEDFKLFVPFSGFASLANGIWTLKYCAVIRRNGNGWTALATSDCQFFTYNKSSS